MSYLCGVSSEPMAKSKIISNEFIDGILMQLNDIHEQCRREGIAVVLAVSVHPPTGKDHQSKSFHEVMMSNMDLRALGFAMMLINQRALTRMKDSGALETSEIQ